MQKLQQINFEQISQGDLIKHYYKTLDGYTSNQYTPEVIVEMKRLYLKHNLKIKPILVQLKKKFRNKQRQNHKLFTRKQVYSRLKNIQRVRLKFFLKQGSKYSLFKKMITQKPIQFKKRRAYTQIFNFNTIELIHYIFDFNQIDHEDIMIEKLNDIYQSIEKSKIVANRKETLDFLKQQQNISYNKISLQKLSIQQKQEQPSKNFKNNQILAYLMCTQKKQSKSLICCTQYCNSTAFVCENFNCKCRKQIHQDCNFRNILYFKKKLQNQIKNNLSSEKGQQFNQILNQINATTWKLQEKIQSLKSFKKIELLSPEQINFLKLLQFKNQSQKKSTKISNSEIKLLIQQTIKKSDQKQFQQQRVTDKLLKIIDHLHNSVIGQKEIFNINKQNDANEENVQKLKKISNFPYYNQQKIPKTIDNIKSCGQQIKMQEQNEQQFSDKNYL